MSVNFLRENYYCPLKITVFERDEFGDIDDKGYEYDERYAVRYEDGIREQLKRELDFLTKVCYTHKKETSY